VPTITFRALDGGHGASAPLPSLPHRPNKLVCVRMRPHPILSTNLAAITDCWSIDTVLLNDDFGRDIQAHRGILNRYLIEDASFVRHRYRCR